jgi:alpha-galactosidase
MKHNFKLFLISILSILFFSGYTIASRTVWLDELDLSNIDQSAGKALANQSMWKTPLIIAGETFERGVGTHAASIFRIKLR